MTGNPRDAQTTVQVDDALTDGAQGAPPRRPSPGQLAAKVLDNGIGTMLVAGMLATTVVTLLQVFMRYAMSSPLEWSEELSRLMFVWIVFIGLALGLQAGQHISADMMLGKLPLPVQAGIDWVNRAIASIMAFTLIWSSWRVVETVDSTSPALGWPVTLFYLPVPVGMTLLLIYLVRQRLRGRWTVWQNVLPVVVGGLVTYVVFIVRLVPAPSWEAATVLTISLLGLIAIGLPIAFAITVSALVTYWAASNSVPLSVLAHQMENGVDSFLLLAIPFFLLAGQFMNAGGITQRIIGFAAAFVGHLTGGLSHVNVLANFVMGGLSGSSSADAAAIGKIMVPAMARHGYAPAYSCAVTASSSILANLVPPSINLLIYASVTNASVGRLFIGGLIPGVVITAALLGTGYLISNRRGYRGLERRATCGEVAQATQSALWALGMPVIVLGGIRFGLTTPTEAAAVAVLYSFLVGAFIYRELDIRQVPSMVLEAALQTAGIALILGASQPFSRVTTLAGVPQTVANMMLGTTNDQIIQLLMINVLLLLVGLPIEPAPAIIMLTPILMPIAKAVGIDEIHLGIVMVTNLTIGAITPPVGVLAFITATVAKVPLESVFKEIMPFLLATILALVVITYLPELTLFLPNLLMGP